jgi:hypothetical protein
MGIAALVLWILTAGGGFYLLAKWVAHGGHRRSSASRFPPALIFGHFLLAATGLVLWIVYLAVHNNPIGWAALIVLGVVALLGITMFAQWIPAYQRSRSTVAVGGGASAQTAGDNSGDTTPEGSFPVAIVGAHGVLAVTTLILVVLTMVGIGAS